MMIVLVKQSCVQFQNQIIELGYIQGGQVT